jgi:hypothetical protein
LYRIELSLKAGPVRHVLYVLYVCVEQLFALPLTAIAAILVGGCLLFVVEAGRLAA